MKTSISQSHSHISNQKRELLSNALKFLEVRIKTIHTVTQWATRMGYSRCYFSRHIHKIYGETAISILHKPGWQQYAKHYTISLLQKRSQLPEKRDLKMINPWGSFCRAIFILLPQMYGQGSAVISTSWK